jgi:hypothetical protein
MTTYTPVMVARVLEGALRRAMKSANRRMLSHDYQGGNGRENARRSSQWISELATSVRRHLARHQSRIIEQGDWGQSECVVFDRSCKDNRSHFRLNEFLFDILIAQTTELKSQRGRTLRAIAQVHWAVECELKRTDSRAILIDMNKLIVSHAENKLLIISRDTSLVEWSCQTMDTLFGNTPGNLFLATIPHPATWDKQLTAEVQWFELRRDTGGK